MPGKTWTVEGEDHDFMVGLIPEYLQCHAKGKPGAINREKNSFLNDVYMKYRNEFDGRMEGWSLPKVGTNGTEEERKIYAIDVSFRRMTEINKKLPETISSV